MNLKYIILFALLVFIGCSEKEKEKIIIQNTPKIEIIANKNEREIKVKQKIVRNKENEQYYFNYGVKSKYNPDAQPANKDANVRIKPRTTIDANVNIRSPYEKVQISLIAKRLSKDFILRCSACHNDYANGIIGPSLLDKTSKQISKSINDFKTGTKQNPLMNDLVQAMSDQQIKKLADEIYKFNKQVKKIRAKGK